MCLLCLIRWVVGVLRIFSAWSKFKMRPWVEWIKNKNKYKEDIIFILYNSIKLFLCKKIFHNNLLGVLKDVAIVQFGKRFFFSSCLTRFIFNQNQIIKKSWSKKKVSNTFNRVFDIFLNECSKGVDNTYFRQ